MTTHFRMSQIGDKLPMTWSYSGPPVGMDEDPVWKVSPGAQVWASVADIALCVLGADMDGAYDEDNGYDRVLIIEADYTVDGGHWDAVTPDAVRKVHSADTTRFREYVMSLLEEANLEYLYDAIAEDGEGEEVDLQEWFEDREDHLFQKLSAMSEEVVVKWVDTLSPVAGKYCRVEVC